MSVNFALTYANDLCLDGAGAQLQRLLGTYAIARLVGVPYVHSPLTHVGYQGLASLEKKEDIMALPAIHDVVLMTALDSLKAIHLTQSWAHAPVQAAAAQDTSSSVQ